MVYVKAIDVVRQEGVALKGICFVVGNHAQLILNKHAILPCGHIPLLFMKMKATNFYALMVINRFKNGLLLSRGQINTKRLVHREVKKPINSIENRNNSNIRWCFNAGSFKIL